MKPSSLAVLRDLLTQRYDDLKRRLTWRLGSVELASDALHDTWLRLDDRKDALGPVANPLAYLMRMATNVALDRIERDRRYMSSDELVSLMDELVDPAPGPGELAACGDAARAAGNVASAVADGAMAGVAAHRSTMF